MKTELRSYDTGTTRFTDLTSHLQQFVRAIGGDGLASVFVPHATAGVAIFEVGSGSEDDLSGVVDELLPRTRDYVHSHGSPGHGADHVLPALIAPSVTIPVVAGELQLGRWQSVVGGHESRQPSAASAFLLHRGLTVKLRRCPSHTR